MKIVRFLRPASLLHKRRCGFTLTEMAIVIGIVGIILAAIWVAARSVNENNAVDQAAQELQAVSQNLLTLYEGRAWPPAIGCAGGNDITSTVIKASIIPSQYVVNGACPSATQPWASGTFSVSEDAPGAPPPPVKTFRLSFYTVPTDGCIALLLQATACDPNQAGCPIAVMTNMDADYLPLLGPPYPVNGWQGTLNPTKAATLCSANTPGANSVEFDFKL